MTSIKKSHSYLEKIIWTRCCDWDFFIDIIKDYLTSHFN
jgi:hypothetical protein